MEDLRVEREMLPKLTCLSFHLPTGAVQQDRFHLHMACTEPGLSHQWEGARTLDFILCAIRAVNPS
jgi:hypothetical protein